MATQVQIRRGTNTQNASFTGAEGELSANTTNSSVHVHDGSTAGGFELARADLNNVSDTDLNAALTGNTLASLTITSADINGGTIDGTTIGASSAAAANFTTVGMDGQASPNADLHIGTASAVGDATNPALQFGGSTTYRLGMYTDAEGGYIENKNGDNGLIFRVKTAGEAMRIDGGTGHIGINISNPDGTLHVHTASAGTVSASSQADDLVIENNAEGGMTIITPDDQSARIRFTSPSTNNDVGGATIFYRQNINKMSIGTAVSGGKMAILSGAGNETIVCDSSGNVAINSSGTIPTGVLLGKQLVAGSSTGAEIIAFREDTSVAVGDKVGAFLIGNSDTDGAEDHFVGMWGKVSSTNGSQDLHFAAGRSGYEGDSSHMTLDSGGSLGIGTDPSHPLHITKEIAGYQAYFNNDNGSAQGLKVRIKANDSGNFNVLDLVSAATGSDQSVMVVRDDGKIGIGQTGPLAHVHIKTSTNTPLLVESTSGGGGYVEYRLGASGAVLGYLGSAGELIASGSSSDLGIRSQGGITFAAGGNTKRMHIASGGQLFLFTQTSGAGNSTLKYTTGTGAVTFDTSSRLVKEDIEDIPYGLSTVMSLSPKKYRRTDSEDKDEVGFIADEMLEVVPEVVGMMNKSVFTGVEQDTEEVAGSVEYEKLTAVLTKAIQEQQTLIESLTDRIAALENN